MLETSSMVIVAHDWVTLVRRGIEQKAQDEDLQARWAWSWGLSALAVLNGVGSVGLEEVFAEMQYWSLRGSVATAVPAWSSMVGVPNQP
jgi:hypothetical protein